MTLNGMVKINNKIRHDVNFPVNVLDVLNLSIGKENRYYRLEIINKKFGLVVIKESEADNKIVKIIGKKILNGSKIQMNLRDGQNFLSKLKFNVGDSVVLDTKNDKIVKILRLKKEANVEIIAGKHAGEKGKLIGFEDLVRGRNYEIKLKNGVVSLPYKTILVVE